MSATSPVSMPSEHYMEFVSACRAVVGGGYVLTDTDDIARYVTDWTGKFKGVALAVVRPATTEQVAGIVRLCGEAGVAVVPQGGNTGLCGGGVPAGGRDSIVLSLNRMNRIRSLDPASRTVIAEAGVVLENLHNAALEHGLIFPLMFGAKGSCTIGGNLSTNAGGSNVVRYGNTRELCLGLEAVLADGSIINGLTGLRKDNTGYDLKDLLIGAEGTLGIITAAVFRLYPERKVRATAFLSLASLSGALHTLNVVQDRLGGCVEAFEYMPQPAVDVICKHVAGVRPPVEGRVDTGILIEVASSRHDDAEQDSDGSTVLSNRLIAALSDLIEEGVVLDAVFASSEKQRVDLWKMRESILEAITADGPALHLDISLPLASVEPFMVAMDEKSAALGFRPLTVGHLGDGNLHYALATDDPARWNELPLEEMKTWALDLLARLNGSFSAEHGIGQSKALMLRERKEPAQIAAMKAIRQALDPQNIMNPGKMLI